MGISYINEELAQSLVQLSDCSEMLLKAKHSVKETQIYIVQYEHLREFGGT